MILIRLILATAIAYPTAAMAAGEFALPSLPMHTQFFIGAAALATVYFGHLRFDRFAVTHGPEILTTLGIFGCFFGVSIGLYEFNTADIARSVPAMLEGIRTAFWASLCGIGGALYLKFRHAIRKEPIPQAAGASTAATIDDLLTATNNVHKAICNGDEGSLLGQLKLVRQDQSDGLRALNEAFKDFARTMAEQNSRALIEALNGVIRDFNEKLTEQFGENFKQLNQGVERLVTWQGQYKDELNLIKEVQKQAAGDMRIATEAYSNMVRRAEHFAGIADRLAGLITALDSELARAIESERVLHNALSEMSQVAPEFAKRSAQLLDELRTGLTRVNSEFEAIAKQLVLQSQANNVELQRSMREVISEASKQFSTSAQQIMQETKEHVKRVDEALGNELSRSIESLGQQLTALSRRFVEDYTPLTEKLQVLVNASRIGG